MASDIGRRIAARRADLELSQQDLASRIGVTRPTVSYWETGHVRDVKARHLSKLAAVLRVPSEWLLFGDKINEKAATYITEDKPSTDIEERLIAAIRRLPREEQEEELTVIEEREARARRLYEELKQRFGE